MEKHLHHKHDLLHTFGPKTVVLRDAAAYLNPGIRRLKRDLVLGWLFSLMPLAESCPSKIRFISWTKVLGLSNNRQVIWWKSARRFADAPCLLLCPSWSLF